MSDNMESDSVEKVNWLKLETWHSIRKCMQNYEKGSKGTQNCSDIIKAYVALIPDEKRKTINDLLSLQFRKEIPCMKDSEELIMLKRKSAENKKMAEIFNKKRDKKIKEQAIDKRYENSILKMIKEEKEYAHINESLTPENISIFKENAKEYYKIKFKDSDEELIIRVFGNGVTNCNNLNKKSGFNKRFYEDFKGKYGDDGYTFSVVKKSKPEKDLYSITESQYKKVIGQREPLTEEQRADMDIYCYLDEDDRNKYNNLIKSRDVKRKIHNDIYMALNGDVLSQCAGKGNLKELLLEYKYGLSFEKIQQNVVEKLVANDKADIWDNFSSKYNDDSNHVKKSNYEKEIKSAGSFIRQKIKMAFGAKDKATQNAAIIGCVNDLKAKTTIPLSGDLLAEIIAQGIFDEGISSSSLSMEKLNKTNELLNHFGINIRFEKLPITKVPDTLTSNEQSILDRNRFEMDKKQSVVYNQSRKKVEQELGNGDNGIEVHHVKPLRCNAFVDEELNSVSNYVIVAQSHPWNTDMHSLVHKFDTTNGDFLIKDKNDNLLKLPHGGVREIAQKSLEDYAILCPILQLKDNNGKYKDVLEASGKNGECNSFISNKDCIQQYATLHSDIFMKSRNGKVLE